MTGSSGQPETPAVTPETPHPQPPYPYPPGPYPGYPPPPPPYAGYPPPPVVPKNGLGIASLVIAIVALVFVWSIVGGVVLGVVAALLGFVARGRVKRGDANNGGVAVAGIVLGILAIVVGLIFIAIWAGLWKEVGGDDYLDCLENAGSDPARQQQCADQFREHVQEKFSVTLTPSA